MMEEKELISKIRELGQIKPRKEWVVLTKNQILGREKEKTYISLFPKPAYVGLVFVFILFGIFGFSQNSLPGDLFYPIKKITENTQAVFVSENEKPAFQLKLANKRLEDLTKAPVKNLTPTINEFQTNVLEAAKTLSKIEVSTSSPTTIEKIVEETKKLEENKQKVESLGVVIGQKETQKLENTLGEIVKNLIEDLENQSLTTKEKGEILAEMKKLYQKEKYSEAMELYLINQ